MIYRGQLPQMDISSLFRTSLPNFLGVSKDAILGIRSLRSESHAHTRFRFRFRFPCTRWTLILLSLGFPTTAAIGCKGLGFFRVVHQNELEVLENVESQLVVGFVMLPQK